MGLVYLYDAISTINNVTIDAVSGWAGIYADKGTLSVVNSSIENVIITGPHFIMTSTISNTVVENGGGDGLLYLAALQNHRYQCE